MTKDQIQENILTAIYPYNRCGINVGMGVGKTMIAIKDMNRLLDDLSLFLVVIPKTSIIKTFKNELETRGYDHLVPHIHFVTYRSLNKRDYTKYSKVYFDECHNLLMSHISWLDKYSGPILGMTGTLPDSRSVKSGIINKYCPIVFNYSVDDAIQEKLLNDYQIYVHMLSLGRTKTVKKKTKKGGVFLTSEQMEYDYFNNLVEHNASDKARILRMRALMNMPSKEKYTIALQEKINKKCLIFANTKKQADIVCKNSYHSSNYKSESNLEKFKSAEITKLSAVLQLSEGINIPDLETCIIMHSYANNSKSSQRLARCLRLIPTQKATIHILCYRNTIDEQWVRSALDGFDKSKIKVINAIL